MTPSRTPNMVDYETERRNFHLDVPEYFNFAIDTIGKWAQKPDKLAMLWIGQNNKEQRIPFKKFADRSSQAANAFRQLGIQKGDRVMVMLPRIPEWWESVLGLMKIGAIAIPCTTLLTAKDIQYRAEIAEVQGIITDDEGKQKVDQVREACPTLKYTILIDAPHTTATTDNWESYHAITSVASVEYTGQKTKNTDPCLIYFTSGTVGYPKMVLHTHARTNRCQDRSF